MYPDFWFRDTVTACNCYRLSATGLEGEEKPVPAKQVWASIMEVKTSSPNLKVSPLSENIPEYFRVLNSLMSFPFLTAFTGYADELTLA